MTIVVRKKDIKKFMKLKKQEIVKKEKEIQMEEI